MNNSRRLTATPHAQRCTMCDRWMLTGTLCMECATDGPIECDYEVDETTPNQRGAS